MLGFLFFIIIFVFVIVLIIISTVFGFLKSLFSFGRRNPTQHTSNTTHQPQEKRKIFDKKDGEYVDYEEVK
jgi:hypothetical protein